MNTQDFWEEIENEQRKLKGGNFSLVEKMGIYEDIFIQKIEPGKVIKAVYMGLDNKNYMFESEGLKDYIYVDYNMSESRYLKNFSVGEKTDIIITKIIDKLDFRIKGSVSSLYETRAMDDLNALNDDDIVKAFVKSVNPAGYDLDILHDGLTIPGFMPNTLAGVNKLSDPESLVGMEINVMIESYSEYEGTYILSRRRYLETLKPKAIEGLMTGTVYSGRVTGTAPFGIFVEFGEEYCLTGLIHKLNVHPDWKDKISEIEPGFNVDFYVKEIIKDKIVLTQILRDSIWDNIEPGELYEGVVKDVRNFGILIKLDDETMGLIHQSEVDKYDISAQKGDTLNVKVLYVDRQNRKIFLSTRN